MSTNEISFRGVIPSDAEALFPMIHKTVVTETILWDGPEILEEYIQSLTSRSQEFLRGENHFYTILFGGVPVGSATLRPENDFRGDIGLWVGEAYHGHGIGTEAIRFLTELGFGKVGLQKIEGTVFVGNQASRKIFEKNGYSLEGTIRRATRKRGVLLDEWLLGKVSP